MLNQDSALGPIFEALADPTRRAILERLGQGPASVSELAKPLPMSLPAVVQHLKLLEECGLVTSRKQGRIRTCALNRAALDQVGNWLNERRPPSDKGPIRASSLHELSTR